MRELRLVFWALALNSVVWAAIALFDWNAPVYAATWLTVAVLFALATRAPAFRGLAWEVQAEHDRRRRELLRSAVRLADEEEMAAQVRRAVRDALEEDAARQRLRRSS